MEDVLKESCSKGGEHTLYYDTSLHIIQCSKCHKTWVSKKHYPEDHKPLDNSSAKSSSEG